MFKYITEILIALILRNLPINKYLSTIIIIFLVTYYNTKNFELSLCLALITLVGYTMYNYFIDIDNLNNIYMNNILLIIYLIFIFGLLNSLNKIKKQKYDCYVCYINYILLLYIFISLFEYFAHKKIMHCDNNEIVYKTLSNIFPYLKKSCSTHKEHHLEVKPNMLIKEVKDEETLTFGWRLYLMLTPIAFIILYLVNYICKTNFTIIQTLINSIIVLLIIFYMWNKIHPKFHDYDIKNFTIKNGPYDNGLFNMSFFEKLLYRNHEAHHIQKGEQKGNYNIILLGADEWMDKNVRVIDNKDYCKTHMEEEICKEN